MSKDGKDKAAQEPREIPIDGADEVTEGAAEAAAPAMRDKYLRLQAEWDNYRKRTAEEAGEMRVRAAEKLMGDLLPVMDDFERAIAHAEANGDAGLLDGVKAISTKLSESLGKHGQVEDASVPDETVAQVYQKGYRLGKKVIRPAMVTISTGGPKREVESDDAE